MDVEEYFHATNIEDVTGRSNWSSLPSRVVESTERVLEIFSQHNTKATFFVLGYVARRHPALVKAIANEGHEIASHGFRHRLVYKQSPKSFLKDVKYSKLLLEDISSSEVLGYRAPNFSITPGHEWAYDCLIETGYKYDSSTYPTWHPRYANTQGSRKSYVIQREKGEIIEFPLAVAAVSFLSKEFRFPVAGGAYWRLLPRMYCRWGLARINERDQTPCHCYFHPWELDPEQPRFRELSMLSQLRHYAGAASFPKTLSFYLERFSFGTIKEIAENS